MSTSDETKKDGRKSGFEIRRGACVLKLELLFSTLTGPFVLDSIHSSQLLLTPMPSVVILTSPLKTDVVLLSKDGTRFPFRRSFLETASPWFAQAFSKEMRRNEIQMQESAVDLDLFLRFIGRNAWRAELTSVEDPISFVSSFSFYSSPFPQLELTGFALLFTRSVSSTQLTATEPPTSSNSPLTNFSLFIPCFPLPPSSPPPSLPRISLELRKLSSTSDSGSATTGIPTIMPRNQHRKSRICEHDEQPTR